VSYIALCFDVDAAQADDWADALLAAGALSVDAADPGAGTPEETPIYGEPGEPSDALWPVSRLTVLFAPGSDAEAALRAAGRALDRSPPPHETRAVAEQDWVRATQAQFAPLQVADRLWVVPSWCTPPDPQAVNLMLDPGLAFGTGSHPTTRLCLAWLARNLRPGERVLDYGCGSGILAIAAARLGAGETFGVDVDPQAIVASRANARANDVDATFLLPDELAATGAAQFDVLVANILANPLRLLAPALAQRVRPGGRIAISGVLAAQAGEVAAAYEPWFTMTVLDGEDGWIALAGQSGEHPSGRLRPASSPASRTPSR